MKNRILEIILENSLYKRLVALLQRVKLGKSEIGLYDAIVIFLQKMSKDEIMERANAVAFSFTIAIFPAIIFLFTLTPYIQLFFPEVTNEVVISFLSDILPNNLYLAAETTINDIIGKERGGLLSFGFIMALILSTNGMTSLMTAFNACYKTVETRGFFKMRFIATGLIVLLGLSVLVSVAVLVVGQHLLDNIQIRDVVQDVISLDLVNVLRFLVLYIIFQIAISCIYYFAPAVHERWHFFSIGSVFSTLATIAASFGFSFYVNQFGTYNKLYGSIGVLIVLMLWLFILSLILLVGFEMNAAIDTVKVKKNSQEAI
ncbi:membrane protein [Roseivirga pacifica]|uniref:Membrane protein n=1 Tax=Roseivirga pacifica TaxID=1267423 RepID=A0A1I0M6E7_9BACT|nr:YihY/virulence factor BrkB family protein [Roseivirga pacifica]RKQ50082.1 membrane protein [Roseivirga pacifica]SEV83524.1 membrane protein [Roseivirga pacifica]